MNPFTQLLLGLVVAGATFWMFDNLNDQLDQARLDLDQVRYERDGLLEAARISGERLAVAAAMDQQQTQELTNALNHNRDLQRAVADGHQRLLVKATCSTSVPANPADTGLADAGTAELAADARPDYFTLRDEVTLSREMILGLQARIRTFCTTTPTTTGATE